ncbi:Aspartokinase / Diaminopimelate decarboxylase, partial [hydrothermal vent metagenome]
MAHLNQPWVVLKFGGTSVASLDRWQSIARIVQACADDNARVLVVHSAIRPVSDLLEQAIEAALRGEHLSVFEQIKRIHTELGTAMQLDPASQLEADFAQLARLLSGVEMTGEASHRVQAKIMALGEIMATRLGAAFLNQAGVNCSWMDARELLIAASKNPSNGQPEYLSAWCDDAPDATLQQKLLQAPNGIVLTQGFIAANAAGETVLLGRGGSDTSAALFAAKLKAKKLEIWTDVPGMFSADPRQISSARLLKDVSYPEAQEIASMGAKVIHPRSFPPVRRANIPVHVRCTHTPELPGTLISASPLDTSARVKAITVRGGITLVSLTTSSMWKVPGFLARAFAAFAEHGLSIDLVTTSETSVTVSLDAKQPQEDSSLEALVVSLQDICKVEIVKSCATVSLVGQGIRTILHKLTPTLELFREHPVRLLSLAANDLNLTVVVDEEQANLLASRLHDVMVDVQADDPVFGPPWDEVAKPSNQPSGQVQWWQTKQADLLEIMQQQSSAYVYDLETVDLALAQLNALQSVSRCYYAMKANAHPKILERVIAAGAGVECVSIGEMQFVLQHFPQLDTERLLFTPNFAAKHEYEFALSQGIRVTVDGLHPLKHWPEIFANARLNLRVDPQRSRGHHRHVLTAGDRAKFGVPASEIPKICQLAKQAGATIDGLHAHAGSGILDPGHWRQVGEYLAEYRVHFPELAHINLGGGLGVPERPGGPALDMDALDAGLATLKKACDGIDLWLEPGRFVVAEAGVLLSRVTQVKSKHQSRFIGIETG